MINKKKKRKTIKKKNKANRQTTKKTLCVLQKVYNLTVESFYFCLKHSNELLLSLLFSINPLNKAFLETAFTKLFLFSINKFDIIW